jgi:hypothetical protein
MRGTFVEEYLSGRVGIGAIDDFVDEWHESSGGVELHDHLGLTWDEYRAWVERPESLPSILARRQGLDQATIEEETP